MDLGLYMMKMPFRKLIGFLLPLFAKTDPNLISIALLPVGIAMAACYWWGITDNHPGLLLVAVGLGFLRMVVATLDGLVAVTYNTSSVTGDFVNRMTPELCDLLTYPVLICALQRFDGLGVAVLTMSWAITFFGLLGAASGCPVQSVGPAGQTDRLAALMLFSFLQFLSLEYNWQIDFFRWLFIWIVGGGLITISLRFSRSLRAVREKDRNVVR